MAIISRTILQSLGFSETVRHNQKLMFVSDNLAFDEPDDLDYNLHEHLAQNLVIGQSARISLSTSRLVSQSLTVSQSAKKSQVGNVYQNFTINESFSPGNKWPAIFQSLSFQQNLSGTRSFAGGSKLLFNQTVTAKGSRRRTVSQTLSFQSLPAWFKPTPTHVGNPTPPTGQPTTVYTGPGTGPVYPVTEKTYVKFAFGSNIIQLRPPEFGNTDKMELRRIQRETRNRDLIIYRDPTWSASEQFELEFTYLKDTEVRAFQDFIRGCLGQLVIYTDYDNNQWIGLFNNPELEIVTAGRTNNTVKITFEVIFE